MIEQIQDPIFKCQNNPETELTLQDYAEVISQDELYQAVIKKFHAEQTENTGDCCLFSRMLAGKFIELGLYAGAAEAYWFAFDDVDKREFQSAVDASGFINATALDLQSRQLPPTEKAAERLIEADKSVVLWRDKLYLENYYFSREEITTEFSADEYDSKQAQIEDFSRVRQLVLEMLQARA